MPPTTETRWCHGAQSRLLTLQPLPSSHYQLAWTPHGRCAAPSSPRRCPRPSARILRIQQIVGELQEVSRLSHPGIPLGGLQLGQGPALRPKVLCSPHLHPNPFGGDLYCSAAFDSQPKHPGGQRIRQVGRLVRLLRSTTRLLATHLVTTCTPSKGTTVPSETSGRSRPMAVSGQRRNVLVPLLQWHEGRSSRGATSRHFLLNRQ
ncbi:MAG: hypothetical protein JWR34_4768 [Mycobacterium sp.]|nr:hypothetical protein [Mycobacterium sp.]